MKKKIVQILVIDGQGGKIGKELVEKLKASMENIEVIAVGTNSIATSNMIKGGADNAATGENAVVVCAKTADVIVGPVGIVIADSMLGEVTEHMAAAVGKSLAKKVLIPINRCNHYIVGMEELPLGVLVERAVKLIEGIR